MVQGRALQGHGLSVLCGEVSSQVVRLQSSALRILAKVAVGARQLANGDV
jgi:hypothetical protein